MSTKFESSIRQISYPQQNVYNMLSDLSNLEKVKDRVPADKIQDFSFDSDTLSVKVAPVGAITMRIVDREEPKCIKFETSESPMPFNFWIQILPVSESVCKMKLTIKSEVNPFLVSMIKKPLQEGLEKIADMLQMINYE
ncbi:MAG: SRPBCC family protein [Prevotella sp.]